MTIPRDVLLFEILLYVSLLLDALVAAVFGVTSEVTTEAVYASLSLQAAVVIAGATLLVWLAARRRMGWARWVVFAFFALTLLSYAAAFGGMTFGPRMVIDLVSTALTIVGFYFSFTAEARQWFKS